MFSQLKINRPEYEVKCDDRGLRAVAQHGMVVQRKLGGEDISIQEWIGISEEYLPEMLEEEELMVDMVKGVGRENREREVRMARQEMQGIFELFEGVDDLLVVLDKGTTGIFEVVKEEDKECLYCDARHRSGDCVFPYWEGLKIEDT